MYLFNPDNDLALAHFNPNYTPPASAVAIAQDLAVLPVWYAPDGIKIVAEKRGNEPFLSTLKELFSLRSSLISFSDIPLFPGEDIVPWGWNPALRKKLLGVGVPEYRLPSVTDLQRIREYSGRQCAVNMLQELKPESAVFCGESHFFTQMNALLPYLSSQTGDTVLKMPNSGSGKGLVWIKGSITDKQQDWCRQVIRKQGGVVAEPVLDRVHDFAMEFFMENGSILFAGYSLFQSAASGAYMGNFLLPDDAIEELLAEYVPLEELRRLRSFLERKLTEYFPAYNGYLGVDMMICRTSAGYRIQPCVEMNMRMNMGMVARIFYERFVESGASGRFMIGFFRKGGEALAHRRKMSTNHPLNIESGRIRNGFLSLTPVTGKTRYVAYAIIG